MKRLILSAYRCDPTGVSEAYSGFTWAAMVARYFPVLLCTPAYNVPAISAWLATEADAAIRENLELLSVECPDIDQSLGTFGAALKPGFFMYESRLLSALRDSHYLDNAGLVWHRTPMSYRFRTQLYQIGLPLIVGPVGGGLQPPAELAEYFRGEGILYRLRALDGVLLRSRYWMRALEKAAVVFITLDYVRDILPERFASKLITLPDTMIAEPLEVAERDWDELRILYVGRMVRYKGPQLAVEAFARFVANSSESREATLTMVGDGPELETARAQAYALGVGDRVTFTGELGREQAVSQYPKFDILLFPSLTEASGNVYLEAMRAGLALVVVANGGGKDIPCDGAAIKVPLADRDTLVKELSEGLEVLFRDRALCRRMGARGQQCIRERFTEEAVSSRLQTIVGQLIEESS